MKKRLNADTINVNGKTVNVGIAVDTERGLLVPVIKHADRKGLREIGEEFETTLYFPREKLQ